MQLLEVQNLSFSYGSHRVLENITFSLGQGEVVALLGPNGVGKSTLFRCVLGFLSGYDGNVRLGGDDISRLDAKSMAHRIAYIPQVSAPVFDYTVMELVLMGLAASLPPFTAPGAAEKARAQEVLDDLGIGHLAHTSSGHISGGEYQMALLARALLQEAQVLVMDEPTANLDYGNQFRVMQRIADMAGRGFGVLMSSHDPNQVLQHATRVLAMKDGELLVGGRPCNVMTPELLRRLYEIGVCCCEVPDAPVRAADGAFLTLCYPTRED